MNDGLTNLIPKRIYKHPRIHYEYKTVPIDTNTCLVDTLNTHGAEGWKMVDKEPRYVKQTWGNSFVGYSILFMRRTT